MAYFPAPEDGQAPMADSLPVVIASDQTPIPVTGTVVITGGGDASAANQTTEITQLTAILNKIIAAPATESTVSAIETTLSSIPFATQTTLAAILAKIITAPATEAKQDTGNTHLASIDTKLTSPLTVTGTITVDESTLATSAKQDTGNTSLATIASKDFATQTSLAALITANHTDLAAILTKLNASLAVTGTFWQATQPVSAASLPLPTGAATAASQTTGNNSLASIDTKLTNPLPVSGTVNTGLTQPLTDAQLRATPVPVSGTISTGLTQPITQAQFETEIDEKLGDLGQKNMAGSAPVTIASDQTAIPISGTVTVTGGGDASAAKQDVGNASLASIDSKLTNPLPVSQSSQPLPTGASTSSLQTTGNTSLASIDTKLTNPLPISGTVAIGAGSAVIGHVIVDTAPVTHIIVDSGTLTAVTSITNALPAGTNLLGKLGIDQTTPGTTNKVTLGADVVHTIVDSGSITANAGTNLNTSLLLTQSDFDTKIGTPFQAGGSIGNTAFTANAGTNLNTSLLALETGGNLAAIKTDVDKIPSQGQAAMAASMPVVIASNQTPIPVTGSFGGTDSTSLYNGTISATGAISAIDTTGYNSLVAQFTGVWIGTLIFEGSNDNTNWFILLSTDLDTLQINETITTIGFIGVKVASKYVRINVLSLISGTIPTIILGRTAQGVNAADVIALAMDRSNNAPLYTQDIQGFNRDTINALIPSDNPQLLTAYLDSTTSTTQAYDTTGYQSCTIQMVGVFNSNAVIQTSNDGKTWIQTMVYQTNGVTPVATVVMAGAGLGIYIFPTVSRYFRVLASAFTSGQIQLVMYLRQQPLTELIPTTNLAFIAGTAPVTAGVTGTLAVGGSTNVGSVTNLLPLVTGGVDSGGLVRRILTDTSGRPIVDLNGLDTSGTNRNINVLPPTSNSYNITTLPTQDVGIFEGMTMVELLGQIWKEIKMTNYYLSELPNVLDNTNGRLDEPYTIRNDFENSLAN